MNIAVLGDGITAKSVIKTLERLPDYHQVGVAQADLIVASPGIDPRSFPTVSTPIVSEVEFAHRLFHRPGSPYCPTLIGVTGTNGKTTTTSLIAHLLQAPAVGNIGVPLIEYVDHPEKPPVLVVELSSFQLELCSEFHVDVAVLLNLTPDHVDRHPTMQDYANAKAKLFAAQGPGDALIYFDQDPYLIEMVSHAKPAVQKQPFNLTTLEQLGITALPIPGDHNRLNTTAGILAALAVGLPLSTIQERLATFQAPEHRLEPVPNQLDRHIYNDSKATNPESTLVAVHAFKEPVLILCGKDKGLELNAFLRDVAQRCKAIIAFGELATRIQAESTQLGLSFHFCSTLEDAIVKSLEVSKPNDVILFSPSSSSFDQFDNFEHRGRVFKATISNWKPA